MFRHRHKDDDDPPPDEEVDGNTMGEPDDWIREALAEPERPAGGA